MRQAGQTSRAPVRYLLGGRRAWCQVPRASRRRTHRARTPRRVLEREVQTAQTQARPHHDTVLPPAPRPPPDPRRRRRARDGAASATRDGA